MNKPLRWLITAAAVVGSVLLPATPARAYTQTECHNIQGGTPPVEDSDIVRVDSGYGNFVDFGDHPHWGGAPRGDARVCWYTNGGVSIIGHLFADGSSGFFNYQWSVSVRVRFIRANGVVGLDRLVSFSGNNAEDRDVVFIRTDGNYTKATLDFNSGSGYSETRHRFRD